jgi:hypothetical protein
LDLDGVQVISEFQKQIEATTEKPKQKKKLSSVRIWKEDKPLLDLIFERLGLDDQLNQSEKMGQLLQWIKELKEDEPKKPLPDHKAIELSQAISEIQPFQDELIKETITIKDEPDETTVAVSPLSDPNTVSITELNQAPSHNITASGLEAKIDKLVDVMTQFISLQMKSAMQPKATAHTETKRITTEAKPQTASNSDSKANLIENDATTQQRSKRNSPEAETAINNAINAIIEHNNTTELHDLKWALSINAVKELVSEVTKSQRLVEKAIKERFEEIEVHHAHHQIEPNHNHRHKRKRTIRESIPSPSAKT